MTNQQLLNAQFLKNNLNLLRNKKGCYFDLSFLDQLENTAFEVLEAINKKNGAVESNCSSNKATNHFVPTKISESFIDLCLGSIEDQIKNVATQNDDSQPGQNNQEDVCDANTDKLAHIAYDLFCLSVYIRFTLDPVGASCAQ